MDISPTVTNISDRFFSRFKKPWFLINPMILVTNKLDEYAGEMMMMMICYCLLNISTIIRKS